MFPEYTANLLAQSLDAIDNIKEQASTTISALNISDFSINIGITIILAFVLGQLYVRFGRSLSNRTTLAKSFVLLASTTMVVITIVKSSLALSLGLVGALSIVRFRTAIKEPEELVYLFLCIAIGLGLGADQREVTGIAFGILAIIIILSSLATPTGKQSAMFLTVTCTPSDTVTVPAILAAASQFCNRVDLKRLDESDVILDVALHVGLSDIDQLESCRQALRDLDSSVKVSFFDSKHV